MDIRSRNTRVKKEELLETLKKNRAAHLKTHEVAVADYLGAVKETAAEMLDNIKEAVADFSKDTDMGFAVSGVNIEKPESYEGAYDTVIKMIEMETRDELDLSSEEFQTFVMNDWDWSENYDEQTRVLGMMHKGKRR
jgi:hypothetical protein